MSNRFGLRTLSFRLLRGILAVRPLALILSALGAAVLTFLLLPGAASYALWNGTTSANAGAVTAATISVTEGIATPFAPTFHSGATVTTGAVVVTNTSNVSVGFTSVATLAAGTSAPLAQDITVNEWPATAAAPCSPLTAVPAGAYTATLSAWAATAPTTGTLAAGAAYTFCVRDSMNVAAAPGIASGSAVDIVFGSTVTAGTTWTKSASVALTQNFVDDIAPTAPTGLTARTGTAAPVVLSWTAATDNVGVVSYDVYRSGTTAPIGSTSATTFTDSAAVAKTTYTYTVVARDAVGNGTAATSGASIRVDRSPPGAPVLTLTSSTATSASLSFTASDDIGVTGFTISRDGSAIASVSVPSAPTATGTYTDTALPPGPHTYTVTASDAAGNVSLVSNTVAATGGSTTIQPGAWYQVVSASTKKCVTVPSSVTSGTALTQAACANPVDDGQAWSFTNTNGLSLVWSALPTTTSSQYFWDVPVGTAGAGAQVSTDSQTTGWVTHSNPNAAKLAPAPMQWTSTPNSDGTFSFTSGSSTGTSLCLSAPSDGGPLTVATCSPGAASQSFYLVPVTP